MPSTRSDTAKLTAGPGSAPVTGRRGLSLTDGVGLDGAGLDGAGLDGLGLDGDGVGLDGDGVGLDGDGVGLDGDGVGLDGDGVGLDGDGVGLDGDGVGLDGDGVGLDGDGVGLDGDGVGLDGDGDGLPLPDGCGESSNGHAWLSWNCVGGLGALSVITADAPVRVRPAGVYRVTLAKSGLLPLVSSMPFGGTVYVDPLLNVAARETKPLPSLGGPPMTNSQPSWPAPGWTFSHEIVSKPSAVVGTLPELIGMVATGWAEAEFGPAPNATVRVAAITATAAAVRLGAVWLHVRSVIVLPIARPFCPTSRLWQQLAPKAHFAPNSGK